MDARSAARSSVPRLLLALTTLCALLLGLATMVAGPAAAAIEPPKSPEPAPGIVEGFAPYLPQVSCDPVIKPGVAWLRSTMMSVYGGRDLGVTRACDIGARSEHKEGRAWDWGLDATKPAEKAIADEFLGWLLAAGPNGMNAYNARRIGVMYIIYDGRIWSSYLAGEGWRKYSGGESHGGHLHISMAWNGAMARTSWWTGKAADIDYGPCPEIEGEDAPRWTQPRATPCPEPTSVLSLTGTPLLAKESTGPYVTQLQRLLSVTPVTGYFGPITEAAVIALQKRAGLAVTATTTPATWEAARSGATAAPPPPPQPPAARPVTSGRALPARMAYRVRPGDNLSLIAKRWRSSVNAIRSASRLSSDTLQVGQQLTVPVRSSITKFTWTTLDRGDEGVVVRALQSALRMKPKHRTGFFGPITERRVNKLKASRGWEADGLAGPGVWRALGA